MHFKREVRRGLQLRLDYKNYKDYFPIIALRPRFDDPFRSSQWNEGALKSLGATLGPGAVWKGRLNAETCFGFQPSSWQVEEAWDGMYGRLMLAAWKDIWNRT